MAPLCIPDFTAGCGLGWPHCQTPKPVGISQRQSPKAPRLWFAPVVVKHTESICSGVIPPFPPSAAFFYSSFTSRLPCCCCLFGHRVSYTSSPIKILHRRVFFPPDPGGTAVRACWWRFHHSALSWMNPGLREQTPDLELLRFSLVRSQNCFKPRQIYTVWCHLTVPASECKWHKEHVEQMEWDMHVKN